MLHKKEVHKTRLIKACLRYFEHGLKLYFVTFRSPQWINLQIQLLNEINTAAFLVSNLGQTNKQIPVIWTATRLSLLADWLDGLWIGWLVGQLAGWPLLQLGCLREEDTEHKIIHVFRNVLRLALRANTIRLPLALVFT